MRNPLSKIRMPPLLNSLTTFPNAPTHEYRKQAIGAAQMPKRKFFSVKVADDFF